jgi:iron(III) transport system permease protein
LTFSAEVGFIRLRPLYGLLTYPPRLGLAAATSLPIVLYTLGCLWLQLRDLRRNNFVTVTGKATPPQLMGLGPWRYRALVVVLTIVGCAAVLPFGALVVLSLLKAFGTVLTFGNFGLEHYRAIFNASFTVFPSVKNSLRLALSAATLCVPLGITTAWLVERTVMPRRGIVGANVMVAYGFPSIILGVGVMLGYIDILYGTLTIILTM